jgi:hypothetical protein
VTLPEIRRTWPLAALLFLFGVLGAAPAAAAETIVVLPLELSGGLEGNRADLEAAVVKGLAVAGRPVVSPADSNVRGTYLVHGRIGREGPRFHVTFRLVRTADSFTLNDQDNHCDVADCSVAELARRSARELVRLTLGRPVEAAPAPEPPPVRAPVVVAPPKDNALESRTWPGATALAAGAAAVGVGLYLVVIDGQCSNPKVGHTCRDLKDTRVGGIASIAGGVAAGALGLYLLLHDDPKSGTSVAVGLRPAGLVVAGRF